MKSIPNIRQLFFVVVGLFLILPLDFYAQTKAKKSRILFLLDASSSMTLPWNGEYKRFDVASNVILRVIDSVYAVNNEVEFAVRDYGTRHPAQEKNCTDTELEVPFNIQNVNQIRTRLKYIKPIGFSPIAYSLEQAAKNELGNPNEYDYSIIFITDGGESCQGDICKTFAEFVAKRIKVIPYVIGLDKNDQLKTYYTCLGNYVEVTSADDIEKAIKMIVDANRILLDKPKTLNITTQFSNTPILKDTVKPKPIEIPTKVLAKNELPFLMIAGYAMPIKDKVKIAPIKSIALKKPTLTLDFKFEEPVKPIEKTTDVVPRLAMQPYSTKPIASKPWKGTFVALNKKPSLKLSFDFVEPIVKEISVFPRMEMVNYRVPSIATSNLKGKTTILKKNPKVNIVFLFPIDRDTNIYPKLNQKDWTLKKSLPAFFKPQPTVAKASKVNLKFEVEMLKKDTLKSLVASNYPKRYSYAYRLPSPNDKVKLNKKLDIKFTFEAPKPKASPTPPPSDDLEYTIETAPSTETLVQVYFKGSNGKTYPKATPIIIVNDAITKQKVFSFARSMEGDEPIPQKLAAGSYNFVLTGFNDLYANNIKIVANKVNKVIIKVTEGSLQFSYMGNRNRPIEYTAIVNRRFANGATINQKCTDKLYYEPGTYYVEVNTLPAAKFSVDLTFGAIYELQLPEPGFVQFMNTSALGKIQLLCVLGDQYVKFHDYTISGNIGNQLLTLQPGPYKAIIPINPKMPMVGNKTIEFRVNSNKTTELMLE